MAALEFVDKRGLSKFQNKVDWSGCARLLREKRVEEAPGPPAESEYL